MSAVSRTAIILGAVLTALLAGGAEGYELRLDIDLDDDPTTINEFSTAEAVDARLILRPTEPDEWITFIGAGTGGPCLDCPDQEQQYGVGWFLDTVYESGLDFLGEGAFGILDCSGDPSFNCFVEGASYDGFTLTEPMFIGSFRVWVDTPFEGCPLPAPEFMLRAEDGTITGIEIAGGAVPATVTGWGHLKATYRR